MCFGIFKIPIFPNCPIVVYNSSSSVSAPPATRSLLPARLMALLHNRDYREGLAWEQYQKYDRRLTKVNDPLAIEDSASLLQGIPALHVAPITSRFVHRFPEDALEAIQRSVTRRDPLRVQYPPAAGSYKRPNTACGRFIMAITMSTGEVRLTSGNCTKGILQAVSSCKF